VWGKARALRRKKGSGKRTSLSRGIRGEKNDERRRILILCSEKDKRFPNACRTNLNGGISRSQVFLEVGTGCGYSRFLWVRGYLVVHKDNRKLLSQRKGRKIIEENK